MCKLALAGALALVLSSVADADDSSPAKPACYTEAALAADAPVHGFAEVGAVQFHGDNADEAIFVQGKTNVLTFLFLKGCMVGQMVFDTVTPDKGA